MDRCCHQLKKIWYKYISHQETTEIKFLVDTRCIIGGSSQTSMLTSTDRSVDQIPYKSGAIVTIWVP